jgi:hypothetical protein
VSRGSKMKKCTGTFEYLFLFLLLKGTKEYPEVRDMD